MILCSGGEVVQNSENGVLEMISAFYHLYGSLTSSYLKENAATTGVNQIYSKWKIARTWC